MSKVEADSQAARALTEKEMQTIARALADPRRYAILKQLAAQSRPVTACAEVRECVEISPATLSHHMRELRLAGLVSEVREGRQVSYELCRGMVEAFAQRLRCELL